MGVRVVSPALSVPFVATAAHCIDPPRPNEGEQLPQVGVGALSSSAPEHDASLMAWEGVGDLALLQEIGPVLPSAEIASEPLGTRESVWILTVEQRWAEVSIVQPETPRCRLRGLARCNEPLVQKGTSGSPAFDHAGRVHALLTRSVDDTGLLKLVDIRLGLPGWLFCPAEDGLD